MEIRMEPPDTTQIDGTHPVSGVFTTRLLYVRIRVTNDGGRPAENVEIMVTNVWRRDADGDWESLQTFLPLTLAWSHVRTPNSPVPARLFRFCDLAHFQPGPNGETLFIFDTIIQPNPVSGARFPPNVLTPGELSIRARAWRRQHKSGDSPVGPQFQRPVVRRRSDDARERVDCA